MIYAAKDLNTRIGDGPFTGELARPLWGGTWMEWKGRLKAAWAVLKGEAVAVRWYT